MKVILTEDVVSLGIEGDVLNVADGYARNYLIPKGLAVAATSGSLKDLEFRRKVIEKKELARKAEAEKEAKKFEGKKLTAIVKVAEEGKLYGSVTISDVANLLEEQLKQQVDKRQIVVHDHIKEVGTYPVIIRLHPEVEATVELEVQPEEGEKASQESKVKSQEEEKGSQEKDKKRKAKTEEKQPKTGKDKEEKKQVTDTGQQASDKVEKKGKQKSDTEDLAPVKEEQKEVKKPSKKSQLKQSK